MTDDLMPGDLIAARDIKPGDAIALARQATLIMDARFANGEDGGSKVYAGPIPGNPKSAVAIKLTFERQRRWRKPKRCEVHVHPGEKFTIIKLASFIDRSAAIRTWVASTSLDRSTERL